MRMMIEENAPLFPAVPAIDIRQRMKAFHDHCQAFKGADLRRSVFQLASTLVLFLGASALTMTGLTQGFSWIVPVLIPVAAGLLVRVFIIQHDCGHGSFFKSRRVNDSVGALLSVLTFTPYSFWMRAHNMHHAGSGNLHKRSLGGIDTLTVKEYQNLPRRKRFMYRLYRHPVVLLLIGTPLHVLVFQRIPVGTAFSVLEDYRTLNFPQIWRSILSLDLAIVAVYGALAMAVGLNTVLLTYLPVVVVSAWVGGWLFFIQHQFEDTYWEGGETWNFQEAAVLGSSYYALPKVLQWFSGNIGLHHIHHLCSMIPNYKLQDCLDRNPDLQTMNRMTISESLNCINWALWDEDRRRMVGFKDVQAARAA